MIATTSRAKAVHICADIAAAHVLGPGGQPRPRVRSGWDTLMRLNRLCAAAGIQDQLSLVAEQATGDQVSAALAEAVAAMDPDGLLVLTFTGHSDCQLVDDRGERIFQWCLYDGEVHLAEIAARLAALPATAWLIVVADTCYAAALARFADLACTVVLLAACAENQTTISGPTSEFVVRLVDLVYPDGVRNPDCTDYRWLRAQLQRDTPDAERPEVWTNRLEAWLHRPFDLETPANSESHLVAEMAQSARRR
ncbi:MAG TPA: hypothetical protein VF163_09060 [Micromonosporaceae bacterium]